MQKVDEIIEKIGAHPLPNGFSDYELWLASDVKKYKPLVKFPRLYPNYFALIITTIKGERVVLPMRYRLRPHWAEKDLPTKYNLHNARVDGLTHSRMWKGLFGKNHGLVGLIHFYEWIIAPETGQKEQIIFYPEDQKVVWAPVLYDVWKPKEDSEVKAQLYTFSLITTEPPEHIVRMGKDRFPIALRVDRIDEWLNPSGKTPEDLLRILLDQEKRIFTHKHVKKTLD